jgi:hypothetical protein
VVSSLLISSGASAKLAGNITASKYLNLSASSFSGLLTILFKLISLLIEKYLKVQELHKNKISISSISDWMSETELEVTKYLDTMRTMDDY